MHCIDGRLDNPFRRPTKLAALIASGAIYLRILRPTIAILVG